VCYKDSRASLARALRSSYLRHAGCGLGNSKSAKNGLAAKGSLLLAISAFAYFIGHSLHRTASQIPIDDASKINALEQRIATEANRVMTFFNLVRRKSMP
jgi:hypothetical protein